VRLHAILVAIIIQPIHANHAVLVVRLASDHPLIVLLVLIIIIGYHQITLAHQLVPQDFMVTLLQIVAILVMYFVPLVLVL
jgi:hypothetical protein